MVVVFFSPHFFHFFSQTDSALILRGKALLPVSYHPQGLTFLLSKPFGSSLWFFVCSGIICFIFGIRVETSSSRADCYFWDSFQTNLRVGCSPSRWKKILVKVSDDVILGGFLNVIFWVSVGVLNVKGFNCEVIVFVTCLWYQKLKVVEILNFQTC